MVDLNVDATSSDVKYNEKNRNQDDANNKRFTLSTIEDVEMLTYFLLWKHDYFDNTPDLNNIQGDLEEDVDRLSESKLREFIEKLKINHLITNSPSRFNMTKDCNENTFEYLSNRPWWPSNYNKTKQICEAASGCRSAKQLTDLVGMNLTHNPTLSQSISRLCPLMLFQLQEKECVEEREIHYKAKNKPSPGSVWGFGLLFVTIVSFCSLSGVGILPFLTEASYEFLITILQGLAVGSLVGSALFHLIPQAFNLLSSDNHEYLWRALIIFGGIYLFFWSERLMKIISEYRRRKKLKEISVPSSTSIENDVNKFAPNRQVYFDKSNQNHIHINGNGSEPVGERLNERGERSNSEFLLQKHDHSHGGESGEIATVAWMIILGDGLHNFIDGITIGAAFSQSILEGISMSVAVICEEFPHELGDFAILIGSGMSMRKALGYNFLSACTCYIGMVFGILLGDMADATPYVFAFAGGMFLYISLVDMMGELSHNLEQASKKRGLTYTAQMLILQNIGILMGVSIMFFLAKYSDKINFEGLAPPKNSYMPFTDS
ncbi:hypothetical protein RDWZM_004965 [Blomia tropicalis]|uniref:Zinc transporter ZIP14 n=1 Tax=Blomia tropicalis TaxID=40697 RepID=A0A9Q0M341_BLOTA|nr:hypothetical protein RDWZM_004965 [Blomia tropicalis]